MLPVAAIGLPALAVKPGNTGAQSTASVTISLEIRPSVKVRTPPPIKSRPDQSWQSQNRYLCMDSMDARTIAVFAVSTDTAEAERAPVARWSFSERRHTELNSIPDCGIQVPLNLDGVTPAGNGYVTLLVSPE